MQMHVSSIFWLSPKTFDHSSNREFLSRDTSTHMFSKPSCCTNYNTSSNAGFEEVTVLIIISINNCECPIDSSCRDPGYAYVIPVTIQSHGEPRAVPTCLSRQGQAQNTLGKHRT